jgi:hypothetical protein
MAHENKTNKMERCTNSVRVQQNLIIEFRFQSETYVKKFFFQNVVALGVYTARLANNMKCGQKRKQLALCTAPTCERKLYSDQYNLTRGHPCGRAVSRSAVRIALVYYCTHSGLYTGTVHIVQWCWSMKYCPVLGLATNQEPPQCSHSVACHSLH